MVVVSNLRHSKQVVGLLYRFDLKKSKNLVLSSQPKPTCFIRPISPISVAQIDDRESEPEPIELENSCSWKVGDPGESEGDKSLIDIVRGRGDEAIENMCDSGLRKVEGIERDSVGANAVGGSILSFVHQDQN